MAELRPDLRETENKQEFVEQWNTTAKNLASGDAMRLLLTFSRMLPVNGGPAEAAGVHSESSDDRFLHARLQGVKVGVFDVYYDSTVSEQVQVGQAKAASNGETYYDVWTSFSAGQARTSSAKRDRDGDRAGSKATRIEDRAAKIRDHNGSAASQENSRARTVVQCEVRESGGRNVLVRVVAVSAD